MVNLNPITAWRTASGLQRSMAFNGTISPVLDMATSEQGIIGKGINLAEFAASSAVLFTANPYLLAGVAAWFIGKGILNFVFKGIPALLKGDAMGAGMITLQSATNILLNFGALKAFKLRGFLAGRNFGLVENAARDTLIVRNFSEQGAQRGLERVFSQVGQEVRTAENMLTSASNTVRSAERSLKSGCRGAINNLRREAPTEYAALRSDLRGRFAAFRTSKGRNVSRQEVREFLRNTRAEQFNGILQKDGNGKLTSGALSRRVTDLGSQLGTARNELQVATEAAKEAATKRVAELETKLAEAGRLRQALNRQVQAVRKAGQGLNRAEILLANRSQALEQASRTRDIFTSLNGVAPTTEQANNMILLQGAALRETLATNTSGLAHDVLRVGLGREPAGAAMNFAGRARGVTAADAGNTAQGAVDKLFGGLQWLGSRWSAVKKQT